LPARHPLSDRIKAAFKSWHKQRLDRLDYEYLLMKDGHLLEDTGLTADQVKEALNPPKRWL
jgi:uncharacterized protein YjiS (DUF1127 family)